MERRGGGGFRIIIQPLRWLRNGGKWDLDIWENTSIKSFQSDQRTCGADHANCCSAFRVESPTAAGVQVAGWFSWRLFPKYG